MFRLSLLCQAFLHEFRLLAIGLIVGCKVCRTKLIERTEVDGVALVVAAIALLIVP